MSNLFTVGSITVAAEKALGRRVAIYQVEYLLKSRGIVPTYRLGHACVYDQSACDKVIAVLSESRETKKRQGQNHAPRCTPVSPTD